MAMPLPKPLQSQLDDLALFPDRSDRIEALIEIGKGYAHPSADEVPRTDAARIPGCESEVYIKATPRPDGSLDLRYAVDNPQGISAMALAQILQEGLSGVPRAEVAQIPEEFVYDVFGRELSMGKSMGLMGMIRMAKAEASRSS
ncbi:MAG: SufE family protein [Fimbriimonas sp.]